MPILKLKGVIHARNSRSMLADPDVERISFGTREL